MWGRPGEETQEEGPGVGGGCPDKFQSLIQRWSFLNNKNIILGKYFIYIYKISFCKSTSPHSAVSLLTIFLCTLANRTQ